MIARFNYFSPLGIIKIQADAIGITEVKFVDQSERDNLNPNYPAIKDAVRWLDDYFLGNVPLTYPQFHLNGTDFQQRVWQQLRQIPYGQLAQRLNSSPRAVGNAVGKNPILLFIPCHRILGQNGKLTGYSGGLERKKKLLAIENIKL
ncbi:methylated-DNA--[protein]-cysteine S-methyltransferase [Limosilactobacillus reuteri]|uniref:Methylated-DNA--[protein]-cysteine S-methyltransferase n=1 Tax=Limosilactobacillus reuteri TaxID=1598 RepID=A0A347TA77_LIMRT|nr:methylated-DNA--[protein]-cysteine S-methyltransferase [Limosilactobacillus reuteri]AXX74826.1 methylated-DNA--[protein]-cysteine S-methyltransferase [Limosilactobacillus reuteri]MRG69881.1 methylated-DNA--[protein]-cysteine S-methyltransferase [Limosilactobacillus reuteri]WLR79217.1 methylated-DNA--[protein]-cysteine S-methyltransferase [Limosilactobacillus reuteri]